MNYNLIVVLIFLFILLSSNSVNINSNHSKAIKLLLNQSSRWAIASAQDTNPFIKNLHGNYSVGYLIALRDIASDTEIKNVTGVDIIKFQEQIVLVQREAAEELFKICPSIIPNEYPELTELSQKFN